MRALFNLLLNLPWWVDVAILAAIVGGLYLLGHLFRRRFDRLVRDAVLEVGSPLKDADVQVHAVKAAPRPEGPSPYDVAEDDEEFDPDLDGQPWDDDGAHFYSIDVTITPKEPDAAWDPTALSLVPADYIPDDAVEISDKICPLHSAEIFENGRFVPAKERAIGGAQRVRLLFAVHDGLRAVKFGMFVTYFGHVELPAPLPASRVR